MIVRSSLWKLFSYLAEALLKNLKCKVKEHFSKSGPETFHLIWRWICELRWRCRILSGLFGRRAEMRGGGAFGAKFFVHLTQRVLQRGMWRRAALNFTDSVCFLVSGPAATTRAASSAYVEWSGWIEPDLGQRGEPEAGVAAHQSRVGHGVSILSVELVGVESDRSADLLRRSGWPLPQTRKSVQRPCRALVGQATSSISTNLKLMTAGRS